MNYAIIAAGEGSRLAAEGEQQPKPLVSLGRCPMVERLIGIFTGCGAESVTVITNPHMPQVGRYLRAMATPVPLTVIEKSTAGSMESFAEIAGRIGSGKFCLTTVDTIFSPEAFRSYTAAFEADNEADGYMAVTTHIDDERPLYVDVDPQMRVTAFRDTPSEADRFISAGVYCLSDRARQVLRRCIGAGVSRMRDFQRAMLADGLRLRAWDLGTVFDVDHAADLEAARRFVARETPPNHQTTTNQEQCQR